MNADLPNPLPSEETRIAHGSDVFLHFEVLLPSGDVIDSTFDRPEPVRLRIGDQSLLEGFEKVLLNLKAGDVRTAHLSADEAFGAWNKDNVQRFAKAQFALSCPDPTIGQMMEFADKNQNTLVGVVREISDDEIAVDFNHPLAGKAVIFKVHILKVIPKGQSPMRLR